MKEIARWRCSTKISKTNIKTMISPLLTRPQGCQGCRKNPEDQTKDHTSIRLNSSAIVIYTSYHSTNRQRSNISHDSPLPKTKESYHPFKKKLFTTLQKQLQSTFSYNCSKKKIGLLSLWKMRGLTWKLHADLLYITLFLGSQFVNGSCLCQICSCSVLKFRQVPQFVVPLLGRF